MRLTQDILTFLTANGFECKIESVCGSEAICVSNKEGLKRIVLPVSITAANPEDAQRQSADLQETIRTLTEQSSCKMLIITEDRWRSQRSMMEARLLAHLEVFFPVYARNCEIRKIDKTEAAAFLGIDYNVEIVEMHHNKKLDAPSGTAYRLGEVVCQARKWQYEQAVKNGRAGMVGKRPAEEIGMHALRGGDVVGDHTVIFSAEGERLELSHKASSRDMFARGALIAVEYLLEAPAGLYDMQDVLNLK